MTIEANEMGGELGDIFWDLPPWLYYSPGYDLGLSLYVANPDDVEREYALMARLSKDGVLISEEAIPVFGFAWFKVEAGDFIKLKGALRFGDTGVLELLLYERQGGQAVDAVAAELVAPEAALLPPTWPGAPGSEGFDLGQLLGFMLPFLMLGFVAVALSPAREKSKQIQAKEERQKLLPAGRAV